MNNQRRTIKQVQLNRRVIIHETAAAQRMQVSFKMGEDLMCDTKSIKLMKRIVSRGQERRDQHKPFRTPMLFLSEYD
ncbi:hypothetical protein APX70_05155 [Pseudomonas syringae pv. maculicola]|uniref:Uncharacterized protein n=1 Tax=Pseudomonas syringae pv. maculicola TaxID=59511 RepID=A0A3M2VKX2_PSEYM|nr:hypothetical protein APX70_05155 [Pseudomonas syringae pv. maculicola]